MSAYVNVKTNITDLTCLIEALKEFGWEPVIHEEAAPLTGYTGDVRKQKAHVIVPRKQIGRVSNDLGFLRNGDGSYSMVISQYDQVHIPTSKGLKDLQAFQGAVTQKYAVSKAMANAKKLGLSIQSQETTASGEVKIVVRRWK